MGDLNVFLFSAVVILARLECVYEMITALTARACDAGE
jgi:hypothetical protein